MLWFKKKDSNNESNSSPLNSLKQFIDVSPIAAAQLDKSGKIIEHNTAFASLLSVDNSNNKQHFIDFLDETSCKLFESYLSSLLEGKLNNTDCPGISLEIELEGKDNVIATLYLSRMAVENGNVPPIVIYLIDTTEQKNLELRFAHSQKMQAVGQLAGGIAHDFNNLLTAMIGFCDLLLMRHPAGDPSFADIMQIKQNANRAANLVRQLLAFSRRQTLQAETLDMTEVMAELSNLIRRLIGENVELKMTHGRNLPNVLADQGQLEQVIINLAVNARDAMKNGGILTIQSKKVIISEESPIDADLSSPEERDTINEGVYTQVDISDTGHGISDDILKKIFEPFFSTKDVGKGTGLGLATVYGIIKQSGGHLYVKSTPNKGTTFSLFFPEYIETEDDIKEKEEIINKASNDVDLTGTATIMLVEDETPVRIFASRALRNKGYEILEADCGENAIDVFEAYPDKVDVIVTDVMMPGINGPTMIETLSKKHTKKMKDTQIIFISGYAEDAFIDTYGTKREFNFLPKPFTLKQLASKIKEVLKDNK